MLVHPELRVEITRYVDDYQPGIVQCEFAEAAGQQQIIIGKLPVFTSADLDFNPCYPQRGTVQCEILGRQISDNGVELVHITIGEETVDGLSEFVVLAELVSVDVAALQS
jgi:hypothetical protein